MSGVLSNLFGSNNKPVNLDSSSFENQVKEDADSVLLDVRTPMENMEARIPNSKLIDISSPTFMDEIEALDKSKSYYVYCRSGNRSYHAGKAMIKMGFEKVYNLAPGIIGWHGDVESGN
jgi:rhodanese-related sulfurtransferase